MLKRCTQCKELFDAWGRALRCSKACRDAHEAARGHVSEIVDSSPEKPEKTDNRRPCTQCGKLFTRHHGARRCSKECRDAHAKAHKKAYNKAYYRKKKGLRKKPCAQCGKLFRPHNGSKYCSDECRQTGERIKQRDYNRLYRERRKQQTECPQCGRLFYRSGRSPRCSDKCRKEYDRYISNVRKKIRRKARYKQKTCVQCGNLFYGSKRRLTCSKTCSEAYNQGAGLRYSRSARGVARAQAYHRRPEVRERCTRNQRQNRAEIRMIGMAAVVDILRMGLEQIKAQG